MDFTSFVEMLSRELVWNVVAFAMAILFNVIIMRFVFGLGLDAVIHEIEEVQNVSIGASFFIVALLSSLLFGKMGGDFTSQVTLRQQLIWSSVGMIVATTIFMIAFSLIFKRLSHRKGEHFMAYLRREAIDEQNAAMIWFIGSLAVVPYTLAVMITV